MKRVLAIAGFAATMVLASSLTTFGATLTGWISDSGCGAKGASASHKQCAATCVKEKGAKWVLVNSADKKVYAIDNQDAVSEDNVGMEVKVTGTKKGNSIHVESISASGA